MSRRDSREPFAMFPNRFIDAEMRGELSERQAKLLRFIARRANERKREARLTLAEIAAGVGWEGSDDALRRELRSLRPEWIDYESRQGQRGPYAIRLTGLAVAREGDEKLRPEPATSVRLPHDFRNKAPQEPPHDGSAEADEAHNPSGKKPPQEPPHDSDGSPLPLTSTERSEVKASSDEKLDQVVGETTAAELVPDFPELLDQREPNPFHEAAAAEPGRSVTDRLIAKVETHGRRSPLPGDAGFLDFIAAVHLAGHITTSEALEGEQVHRLVLASREAS